MIQTELQNQKHLWATFLSQSLNYGNFLFSRWWSVKFSFSLISKLLRSNVRIGTSKKCMLNHRLIRRKKETKYDFFFFFTGTSFPFHNMDFDSSEWNSKGQVKWISRIRRKVFKLCILFTQNKYNEPKQIIFRFITSLR